MSPAPCSRARRSSSSSPVRSFASAASKSGSHGRSPPAARPREPRRRRVRGSAPRRPAALGVELAAHLPSSRVIISSSSPACSARFADRASRCAATTASIAACFELISTSSDSITRVSTALTRLLSPAIAGSDAVAARSRARRPRSSVIPLVPGAAPGSPVPVGGGRRLDGAGRAGGAGARRRGRTAASPAGAGPPSPSPRRSDAPAASAARRWRHRSGGSQLPRPTGGAAARHRPAVRAAAARARDQPAAAQAAPARPNGGPVSSAASVRAGRRASGLRAGCGGICARFVVVTPGRVRTLNHRSLPAALRRSVAIFSAQAVRPPAAPDPTARGAARPGAADAARESPWRTLTSSPTARDPSGAPLSIAMNEPTQATLSDYLRALRQNWASDRARHDPLRRRCVRPLVAADEVLRGDVRPHRRTIPARTSTWSAPEP